VVKVIDRDRGYKAFMKRLKEAQGGAKRIVKVGVFGKAGNAKHTTAKMSNVELAAIHEFGRGRVPERSFIRSTVDENRPAYESMLRRVAHGVVDGKVTVERGLAIVGEKVRSDIQNKITSNIPPSLNPETIRAKGSSIALVDTGQLLNSITYEVVPAKEAR
jgi:phage gpG-like protein